jgi:hypothetical protein
MRGLWFLTPKETVFYVYLLAQDRPIIRFPLRF